MAVCLCAVAACALFLPGFVLGAKPAPDNSPGTTAALTEFPPGGAQTVPAALPAPAGDQPTPSAGSLFVALPWGSEEGQVGLVAPGEGLVRGPESLAVAPDGRVVILDSVNRRLVLLDSGGTFMTSLPLPLTEPRFLAVSDDLLYVLDCDADRQVVALDWGGATLGAVQLPELGDVVTGLFVTDSGPCVEVAHERVFLLEAEDGSLPGARTDAASMADRRAATGDGAPARAHLRPLPGRPVRPALKHAAQMTFKPQGSPLVKLFEVDAKDLKAAKTAESTLSLASGSTVEHLVSVDGDGGDGLVVGARLASTGSKASGRPVLWIGRFASSSGAGKGAGAGG
ncbi:MAG: hypothetical protein ABH877_02240, partial [bacterium]